MKLYLLPASPFVNKLLAAAHELGLAERIERPSCVAQPVGRDRAIAGHNPPRQASTLITDAGGMLCDSGVICRRVDGLARGSLFGSA